MAAFSKLETPVVAPEVLVVPAAIGADKARTTIEREVKKGITRPADIDGADIDAPALLYVPFWRVAVGVEGFHVGLQIVPGARGGGRLLPTGGARHKEAAVMIPARSIFPYQPRLPAALALGGAAPIEVKVHQLVPAAAAAEVLAAGEVVDADVAPADAQRHASALVVEAVRPGSALYAKYTPHVRSTTFCLYPLYFVRYRYRGVAARPGDDYFIVISGRTGATVSAEHPSAARAVASRVKRLFTRRRA